MAPVKCVPVMASEATEQRMPVAAAAADTGATVADKEPSMTVLRLYTHWVSGRTPLLRSGVIRRLYIYIENFIRLVF